MIADANLHRISNLFQRAEAIKAPNVVAKALADGEQVYDAARQIKTPAPKGPHDESSLSLLKGQGQAAVVNQELLRVHVSFDCSTFGAGHFER